MKLRPLARSAGVMVTALGLSVALTACGGDDNAKASDSPPANSTDSSLTDSEDDEGSASGGDSDLPAELDGFPLPPTYEVLVASTSGNATTAVLTDIPQSWEEVKAFYEEELPAAGWEMTGDRPFATTEGTELDAEQPGKSVTISISVAETTTNITINLTQS